MGNGARSARQRGARNPRRPIPNAGDARLGEPVGPQRDGMAANRMVSEQVVGEGATHQFSRNKSIMPNTTAITTTSFINSLGVNTHVDFNSGGYQNIAQTEQAINYLGLKNLRDSAEDPAEGQAGSKWAQISAATGAKFDDYMGEGSPGQMQSDLNEAQQIAQNNPGILNYLEGGNEEDDPYATSNGNNLQITAQFQQQVYSVAHSLGLPAINMSFGQGWTAANNWHGDYDKVGDLSSVTDYANAHTYANPGQTPDSALQQLNGDALIAAGSRPIITTEVGWDENQGFSQADIAKYVLDASLDGIKDGDVKTYFYALYDDMAGRFGLMNQDGTPKPAGTALHNLTTLLNDPGANAASFTPGSLNYSLSNTQSGDNALLMEKSDGTFWLSLWNESAGAHSVTLNLGSAASQINVFDPLTGTSAVQTASNTNS
ncbi:MAG: hypothetical protein JO227_18445, partial [Acetobacteraceae bacterium]|nr:hypothetical protein [Acetobacteraceae bacterium]